MLLAWLMGVNVASAAPTQAGKIISNQAQLSYSVDGVAQAAVPSTVVSFAVLEVINLSLAWQDATPVHVNTPQTNAVLTFVLTNTGNGNESFSLQRNNALAGDQFDPPNAASGAIYIENGLQPGFQATGPFADTVYISGENDPTLAAGDTQTVYVVSDIPSALSIGNAGDVGLSAQSRTIGVAGSAPGSAHPNITTIGATSTEQVVTGMSQGQSRAVGRYVIDGAVVRVNKSILSPSSADLLMPGVEIRYRLMIEVQGVGTVQQLVINDPMPVQVNYVPNSITVDTIAKTDASDSDNGQFSSNTVSVNLGNVTAPAAFVIELRAILK